MEGVSAAAPRSVRIAAKAGVTVREKSGPAALAAFQPLYAGQSGQWSLTWHHSRDALHRLAEGLGEDLRVWVASREGTDLCAQLGLYHEGRDVYLWISGAAPESRSVFAFHFLLHSLVRDAAGRGFTTCHLGASMDMPGIETFKGSFGAEARPLHRYYRQARWRAWGQRARWGRAGERP